MSASNPCFACVNPTLMKKEYTAASQSLGSSGGGDDGIEDFGVAGACVSGIEG